MIFRLKIGHLSIGKQHKDYKPCVKVIYILYVKHYSSAMSYLYTEYKAANVFSANNNCSNVSVKRLEAIKINRNESYWCV